MSDLDYGKGDPKVAMWLAAGTALALLVVAAVLHNTFSVVLVLLAVGDLGYVYWLNMRRTDRPSAE